MPKNFGSGAEPQPFLPTDSVEDPQEKDQPPCDTPKTKSRKPSSTPTSTFETWLSGTSTDSTTPDQTLMPLAIEAIEKYGRTRAFSFTHYLNLLPQTEQTIAWVIAELQRDFQGSGGGAVFLFPQPVPIALPRRHSAGGSACPGGFSTLPISTPKSGWPSVNGSKCSDGTPKQCWQRCEVL